MSAVVTDIRPSTESRAALREYVCPRCGRYLFSTEIGKTGPIRQKCHGSQCRRWLWLDLATGKELRAA